MGLLDSVLGAIGGGQQQANDPKAMLIQAAIGMLTKQGGAAGGAAGGLGGLLSAFEGAGLGQVAQSWISNGQNQAISPDQVQQALGSGQLQELAQAAGISPTEAAGHLSEILPGLVDKLTPHGEATAAPGGLDLGGLLGGLLGGNKQA
ncbi:YidB family protein [Collimonas antrihumi]|uniref:YidB family protein n=1 Tax=Collimonas antrihumi TaxID=1940615 RepID=UPI001B8C56C5|nr:YidB family protein [Collimonas antrihumi]